MGYWVDIAKFLQQSLENNCSDWTASVVLLDWPAWLMAFAPAVSLKGVEVQVEVQDHVASVVSTLRYDNKEDKPIEAVFVFPLPGDAAVCHFSATVGSKQIVAQVKEKQQVSSTTPLSPQSHRQQQRT